MNKIIYSLVYNRKKCLNKRGMALVQVEAYLDRKKKYFSTKVYLKPEQWDAKKLVVKNHPNADVSQPPDLRICRSNREKRIGIMAAGQTYIIELLKDALATKREQFFILYLFSLSKRTRIRL